MTRILARLCLLFASLTLVLAAAPQIAAAQDDAAVDDDAVVEDNADAAGEIAITLDERPEYDADSDANAFIVPVIEVGADDTTTVGGSGGGDAAAGLAVTGSEVEPIAAISIGLLAVGGSVLVTSRRRLSLFR